MLPQATHEFFEQSCCCDDCHLIFRLPVVDNTHLYPCGLAKGMNLLANFPKPRLAQSRTAVVIPLYQRVVFVGLLNRSEYSGGFSKISQPLDAITGSQFRVRSRGLDERWPLGSVCVSRRSSV